jgi:hypothetical protein
MDGQVEKLPRTLASLDAPLHDAADLEGVLARASTLAFRVAYEKDTVRLTSGFDVPVVTKVQDSHSVVFKTVGTMINASAVELERGLYKLDLYVDQSSLHTPEGAAAKPGEGWMVPTVPILRAFKASLNPILRDGQTAQHTTATDPFTGEVVKVEVSVSAIR